MRKINSIGSLPGDAAYSEIDSPVGKLVLIVSSQGVHALLFENYHTNEKHQGIMKGLRQSDDDKIILEAKTQLQEYFEGRRMTFNLPLVLNGTDFQIKAWQQLRKIPYATTVSYAEQAEGMGNRKKARPVGMANGVNPIAIIIPCHRVIGASGKLTGFGGGLDVKAALLDLERRTAAINK